MKGIFSKLKWIAGLVVVFLLILATNLVDRQHFMRVRDALVTIYEDRLVVKGYVFELSQLLEKKRVALAASDAAYFENHNAAVNDSIDVLVEKFYSTKLTKDEKRHLDSFREQAEELESKERRYESSELVAGEPKAVLEKELLLLKDDLHALANIQLDEGKRQLYIATRSVDIIDFFTRIEIIVLFVIGVLIQIIILYKPKGEEAS